MKIWLTALILAIALAFTIGCETTEKARAREDMENSRAAYERCLQQFLEDPSKCEALKRAYEADLYTYRQAGKATSPTVTGFIELGPGK